MEAELLEVVEENDGLALAGFLKRTLDLGQFLFRHVLVDHRRDVLRRISLKMTLPVVVSTNPPSILALIFACSL